MSLNLYPCYDFLDPWDIDELLDIVTNGELDDFISSLRISDFPLGTLSLPITKPMNDLTIHILIDLSKPKDDWYMMRVCDGGDGFMIIFHDPESLAKVIAAIHSNTMPLYNVSHNINTVDYSYIRDD